MRRKPDLPIYQDLQNLFITFQGNAAFWKNADF